MTNRTDRIEVRRGYVASNAERTYSYHVCEDCLRNDDYGPDPIDNDTIDYPATCEGCNVLLQHRLTQDGAHYLATEAYETAQAFLRWENHTTNSMDTLFGKPPTYSQDHAAALAVQIQTYMDRHDFDADGCHLLIDDYPIVKAAVAGGLPWDDPEPTEIHDEAYNELVEILERAANASR